MQRVPQIHAVYTTNTYSVYYKYIQCILQMHAVYAGQLYTLHRTQNNLPNILLYPLLCKINAQLVHFTFGTREVILERKA